LRNLATLQGVSVWIAAKSVLVGFAVQIGFVAYLPVRIILQSSFLNTASDSPGHPTDEFLWPIAAFGGHLANTSNRLSAGVYCTGLGNRKWKSRLTHQYPFK
jgi:hypothetical protein